MKTIELDNSEVIAVFSVFEKLIFLSRDIYELSESDVTLLLKAFDLIEKQKQPMFKMMYAQVFKALEKNGDEQQHQKDAFYEEHSPKSTDFI